MKKGLIPVGEFMSYENLICLIT